MDLTHMHAIQKKKNAQTLIKSNIGYLKISEVFLINIRTMRDTKTQRQCCMGVSRFPIRDVPIFVQHKML